MADASGAPPPPPDMGGAQCHFVSLQQYQVPAHVDSAGAKQTLPALQGSAGQPDGGTSVCDEPLPPESSPVQPTITSKNAVTIEVRRTRFTLRA